jgi:hypothetical protein
MTGIRSLRMALSVVALSLGVVAAGALSIADAGAAAKAKPALTVTPSIGLHNGTTVKISGKGFKAKDQLYIVECLRVAKGQGGCSTSVLVPVVVGARGTFPVVKFKVFTGKVGTGRCGTSAATLKSCAISAGNASGGDTASAPIIFAAPKK